MDPTERIIGANKVTAIFGHWPTFHDAEVIWVRLDRGGTDLGSGPTLDVLIHAFERTDQVDADGYYVLRNHVLAHLRFSGITDLRVDDFNQQNALFDLTISKPADEANGSVYAVELDSSWGVAASFHCQSIAVVSVKPCDKDGNPLPC